MKEVELQINIQKISLALLQQMMLLDLLKLNQQQLIHEQCYSNPEKTIAVLTNSINLRNENLNFNYNQLTNENLDFSKIKGVGDFASGLKDSGSKKDSSIKSEPEEFKFINGVLHKKVNGVFTDDF